MPSPLSYGNCSPSLPVPTATNILNASQDKDMIDVAMSQSETYTQLPSGLYESEQTHYPRSLQAPAASISASDSKLITSSLTPNTYFQMTGNNILEGDTVCYGMVRISTQTLAYI